MDLEWTADVVQTSTLPEHQVVVVAVGVAALHTAVGDDIEHCQWTHAKVVSVRRGHGDDLG